MPTVAITAAVAAQDNERAGVLAPILVHPFRRQWLRWTRGRGESSTAQTRVESAEGTVEGEARRGLMEASGEPREADDAARRRDSLESASPDAPAAAFPAASGVYESPVDIDAGASDDDEPYLLTSTPYRTLVRQFALVPLSALLTMVALLLLLHGVWARPPAPSPALGLAVFAAAGWVVSYALRIPLFLLASVVCPPAPALIATLAQVLCEEALRLAVLVLAHLHLRGALRPEAAAFPRVWVLALGWAAAEVAVSVWQGYAQLALYKDVLAPQPWLRDEGPIGPEADGPRSRHFFEDPESYMQAEIEQLLRVRARLELEVVYGVPVPNIPVFISCLQRIDSVILSLALFLNLSASYLANVARQGVLHHPDHARAVRATLPALCALVAFHAFVSLTWSAGVLPRIGVHSASYVGAVLALGALFVGLGRWDAL